MGLPSCILKTDADWSGEPRSTSRERLIEALESGTVLHFTHLSFDLKLPESELLDPALADPRYRNISLSANDLRLKGVAGDQATKDIIESLLLRYQLFSRRLVVGLVPAYGGNLRNGSTSLRVQDLKSRRQTLRSDDSRLHVDAFPSRPTHGERVIRVFTNINRTSRPRVWRVGEPFEQVARTFLPTLTTQTPGSAWVLHKLGITKSRRSEYDHLMLKLHDAMKADDYYQRECPQSMYSFGAGSSWICFSDQTSHAAISGQFLLEQTFHLPPNAMMDPTRAPIRVLERIIGRKLA